VEYEIGQDVTGSERFSQFLTSVDEVEKETGLDFLAELEDGLEDRIEAGKTGSVWKGDVKLSRSIPTSVFTRL